MTRSALEFIALANRWPWLDAPALSLPGGTVELGRLRPIEQRLGIRTTVGGRQVAVAAEEVTAAGAQEARP